MDKYFLIFLFGITSGFNILICGNTLNFWLAKEQIPIEILGLFSLVSVSYAVNFLWAPLIDLINIPILTDIYGRKKSWLILIGSLLSISIMILSYIGINNLKILALSSLICAFFASTQDIILNAIRAEIASQKDLGTSSSIYIFGYRVGMLISGPISIYYSQYINFYLSYFIFANVQLFLLILCIILYKDHNSKKIIPKANIYEDLICFKNEVFSYKNYLSPFLYTVSFLFLFRLADNFISIMTNPFLLSLGFDITTIATFGKFLGMILSVIGGFFGSLILKKSSIEKCLYNFNIIHALSHLMFLLQYYFAKNYYLLFLTLGLEAFTGGMHMAIYITYITSLCNGRYSATKYSFYSAIMGFSRSVLPSISGFIVLYYNWNIFYILVFAISLTPLFFIKKIQK
jgi:PAT family beta-lactamase induction signal transducer AmpG